MDVLAFCCVGVLEACHYGGATDWPEDCEVYSMASGMVDYYLSGINDSVSLIL